MATNAVKLKIAKVTGNNITIHVYRTLTYKIGLNGVPDESCTKEIATINQDLYDTNYSSYKESGNYVIYDIDQETHSTWQLSSDVRLFPNAVNYVNYLGGSQNAPVIPYKADFVDGIIALNTSVESVDSTPYSYYATAVRNGYVIGDSSTIGFTPCIVPSNVPISEIVTKVYKKNSSNEWDLVSTNSISDVLSGVTVESVNSPFEPWNVCTSTDNDKITIGSSEQNYLAVKVPNVISNQTIHNNFSSTNYEGGVYKIVNENIDGTVYEESAQEVTIDEVSGVQAEPKAVIITCETNANKKYAVHLAAKDTIVNDTFYSNFYHNNQDYILANSSFHLLAVSFDSEPVDATGIKKSVSFYSNYETTDKPIELYFYDILLSDVKTVTVEVKGQSKILFKKVFNMSDYSSLPNLGYIGEDRLHLV